jgi:hypothetical protein
MMHDQGQPDTRTPHVFRHDGKDYVSMDEYLRLNAQYRDFYLRQWIPVSERLPEPGMPVLCAMPSGSVEVMRKREYAGFWEWWDGDIDEIAVTHWMPLPQPPRKATT